MIFVQLIKDICETGFACNSVHKQFAKAIGNELFEIIFMSLVSRSEMQIKKNLFEENIE